MPHNGRRLSAAGGLAERAGTISAPDLRLLARVLVDRRGVPVADVEKRGAGRWRARYRDPDNRERSRTFTRRVDAERWLTSVEHAKLSGAYIEPALARVTFGRWAEEWLATPGKGPSAWARDESILRNHLLPTLASRGLGTIKRNDVQALVSGCANAAPRTVRR